MQSSEIQIGLVYLLLFVCFTAAVSALLKKSFTCQATIFLWIQTLLLHHRHTSCSCLLHLPGGSRGHYRHPIACIDLSSKIEEVPFKALTLKANKTSNT